MKTLNRVRHLAGVWLVGFLSLLGTSAVLADAGDTISNQATINYSVGGVPQAAVNSDDDGNPANGLNPTTFVEDRLVNFVVAEAGVIGYSTGAPGQTGVALQFTVTNTSNSTLDFLLAAIDTDLDTHNGGAADTIDANNVQVFVESGATPGFQPTEDTAVFIDELTEGNAIEVYITGDIPAGAVNADTAGYALVAQIAAGGAATTEGAAITNDDSGNVSPAGTYSNGGTVVAAGTPNTVADDPATVQTVFNDPAGALAEDTDSTGAAQDAAQNGQASDSDAFQVVAAVLSVAKTSVVISDPVNGTTNPKAIPGAIVEYTITITNGAGASTAQAVVVSDSLAAEIAALRLAYETATFNAQGTCPGGGAPNPCGILVTAPDINAGVAQAITNTNGDADGGDFTTDIVSMNVGDLDAGESATVQFRVLVQ